MYVRMNVHVWEIDRKVRNNFVFLFFFALYKINTDYRTQIRTDIHIYIYFSFFLFFAKTLNCSDFVISSYTHSHNYIFSVRAR